MVHYTAQHINWCGWENKSSSPILQGSTGNFKESYVSHLFLCLTPLVVKPSRAFGLLRTSTCNAKKGCIMTFEVLLLCLTREMATKPRGIHKPLGLG